MWPFERAAVGAWRRRLAAQARGRVIEIGAGTGGQFRWYAPDADVTGARARRLDARARARRRAAQAAARVTLVEGRAEELQFDDASSTPS